MFAKRDELKNDYIKNELTKKEKAVMWAIFNAAENGDGVAILKPVDILRAIPFKIEFAKEELEPTLKALELDEYIDFVQADKDGEKTIASTLKTKASTLPGRKLWSSAVCGARFCSQYFLPFSARRYPCFGSSF